MKRSLLLAVVAPLAVAWLAPAAATVPAPRDKEKGQITDMIQQAIPGPDVVIGPMTVLDTVRPCPEAPAVALRGTGPYRTAHVQCSAAGWQFYIPVKVRTRHPMVVAARDILPGHPITAADLRVVQDAGAMSDLTASSEQVVVGQTLKAPVSAGEPISLGSLQEPIKVQAGQSITVDVQAGSVTLQTTAVALQQGRVGETILVRNPSTGKQYRVTVDASGGASYDLGD